MAKQASLVFFYFGEDSYVKRLAQETVPLHLAMEGYNKTILLSHSTSFGPFQLSEKDQARATLVDLPTKANFVKYLDQLGKEGFVVDVFIFAHGWTNKFLASKGEYGDDDYISDKFIEANVSPLKLRAVWQCNCYGSTLNDTWTKLGAKVSAGSKFVNFYPTRFKGFVQKWNDGAEFGVAIKESDTKLVYTPVQVYIPVDAAIRAKEWGGDILKAASVLGSGEAAKAYFTECWLGKDWAEGKSGKENMKMSSAMLIAGDPAVTRSTPW